MAEALEERTSIEVIKRDEVIENFQKECNALISDKKRLEEEVESLRVEKHFDILKAKVDSIEKALATAKASEELALERAKKASGVADGLRKEVDVENTSSTTLLAENEQVKRLHDDAKALGLAAAKSYSLALTVFGG